MKSTRNIGQLGNSVLASAAGSAAIGASLFNVTGAIIGAILGGFVGAVSSQSEEESTCNSARIEDEKVSRRIRAKMRQEEEPVY
jgi:outer membrane lipoprotein SlyB